MPISTEELEGGITRVILEGRMDIEGAAAVIGRVTRLLASTADDAAFRERVRSDHRLPACGLSPQPEL